MQIPKPTSGDSGQRAWGWEQKVTLLALTTQGVLGQEAHGPLFENTDLGIRKPLWPQHSTPTPSS